MGGVASTNFRDLTVRQSRQGLTALCSGKAAGADWVIQPLVSLTALCGGKAAGADWVIQPLVSLTALCGGKAAGALS